MTSVATHLVINTSLSKKVYSCSRVVKYKEANSYRKDKDRRSCAGGGRDPACRLSAVVGARESQSGELPRLSHSPSASSTRSSCPVKGGVMRGSVFIMSAHLNI